MAPLDRDRVPAGGLQRAAVAAMPGSLVGFWWAVVTADRDGGDVSAALAPILVLVVGLGLLGMWFKSVRAVTLGAAAGLSVGVGLALLVAGGLLATSS